jgi:pimeloyl-ACP methyl ester carboxylesterase
MTPQQARADIADLGTAPGFPAAFRATLRRHYEPSAALDAPVTVAFGSRDFILLPRQSRHVERLPRGTDVVKVPGCGHIPMTDDPEAVTALISASTARARPVL